MSRAEKPAHSSFRAKRKGVQTQTTKYSVYSTSLHFDQSLLYLPLHRISHAPLLSTIRNPSSKFKIHHQISGMQQTLLLLIGLLLGATLRSQQSPVLEAYIAQGLLANTGQKIRLADAASGLEKVRQADALQFPNISFSANYTVAGGGRSINFPIGDLLNPVYSNLNQINQITFPGAPQYPMLDNEKIQFLPHNFQETKVKFAWPFYNPGIRYNRQIQRRLLESVEAQNDAQSRQLRYDITSTYLQYLKTVEALRIWQSSKNVLLELKRFNEALVKNQVATRDVVALADYEISKADMEMHRLRSTQQTVKAYFNLLLDRDYFEDIISDTSLLVPYPVQYNLADMLAQAGEKRMELKALNAGVRAAETVLKMQKSRRTRPEFYLGGETGFQGYGYHYFDDQAYGLAQVGLNYPLYNGGQMRSQTQQARIEADQMRLRSTWTRKQIELQIVQAYGAWDAAQSALISARSGLEAAEAAYKIINNKYRAGQALLIEWTDANNRVQTAKLQVLIARIDVLLRETELRQAAGW